MPRGRTKEIVKSKDESDDEKPQPSKKRPIASPSPDDKRNSTKKVKTAAKPKEEKVSPYTSSRSRRLAAKAIEISDAMDIDEPKTVSKSKKSASSKKKSESDEEEEVEEKKPAKKTTTKKTSPKKTSKKKEESESEEESEEEEPPKKKSTKSAPAKKQPPKKEAKKTTKKKAESEDEESEEEPAPKKTTTKKTTKSSKKKVESEDEEEQKPAKKVTKKPEPKKTAKKKAESEDEKSEEEETPVKKKTTKKKAESDEEDSKKTTKKSIFKKQVESEEEPPKKKQVSTKKTTQEPMRKSEDTFKKPTKVVDQYQMELEEEAKNVLAATTVVEEENKQEEEVIQYESTLPMPVTYKSLYQLFEALETACAFLERRDQMCVFDKLQQTVQDLCKKNFTKNVLAQIKKVYPEAIEIECLHSKQYKDGTYIIKRSHIGDKGSVPGSPKKTNFWSESEILARRTEFKNRLVKIVQGHHKEYLKDNSLKSNPAYGRDRWEEDFPLENVPEVEEAEMPTLTTTPVKKPLVQATNGKTKTINESPVKLDKPVNSVLKNVSASVVQKVRAREEKAKADNTEEMKKLRHKKSIFSTLPSLADKLRSLYASENKSALPYIQVLLAIESSYQKKYSIAEIEEQLQTLIPLVPEWLQIIEFANVKTLKLNRKLQLVQLQQKLKSESDKIVI